jgi:hypothetical protein
VLFTVSLLIVASAAALLTTTLAAQWPNFVRADVPRTPGGQPDLSAFRRVNYGRLEIDVTVEDPKAYTQPFTVRVNWRLFPEGQLIEFVCNENQRFRSKAPASGR